MRFALLNLSPAQLPDSSLSIFANAGRAYSKLVAKALEPRAVAPEVAFFPGLKVAPDGWTAGVFADKLDDPTAEAYHAVDPRGEPYMMMARAAVPGGELFRDPTGQGQALMVAFLHELAETMGDFYANEWAQGRVLDPETKKIFTLLAKELADPVQGCTFALRLGDGMIVDASDFVLPGYFDAGRQDAPPEPLSHVAKLSGNRSGVTAPFSVAPGGYLIAANASGEGQVFGRTRIFHPAVKPAPWREALRAHPSRRSHRRTNGVAAAA